MARTIFEAWIPGRRILTDPDAVEYGEIKEIEQENGPPLLYALSRGERQLLLIIGHRQSEWRPQENTRICDLDTIELEDRELAKIEVLVELQSKGIFWEWEIVFYE